MFVSADEKFGVELALDDEPPADDVSELVELEDGVLLEDDGVLDEVDGVLDEEDDCATASVDNAKSTAAVVMLRVLGMNYVLQWLDRPAHTRRASPVPLESTEGLPIARLLTYRSSSELPFFLARQVLAPFVRVISSPRTLPSIGMVRPPAFSTPFSIWKSCVMLNSPCEVL